MENQPNYEDHREEAIAICLRSRNLVRQLEVYTDLYKQIRLYKDKINISAEEVITVVKCIKKHAGHLYNFNKHNNYPDKELSIKEIVELANTPFKFDELSDNSKYLVELAFNDWLSKFPVSARPFQKLSTNMYKVR